MIPFAATPSELEDVAARLEALGNPTRLAVFRVLVRAGGAGLAVGQLQRSLGGIAASTLSHHLHRLILVDLVTQERRATTLICRANYPAMRRIVGFLVDECCADAQPELENSARGMAAPDAAASFCCDGKSQA